MDPIVLVIILAVLVPVAVLWALAKSASLRGPPPPASTRRRVDTLVTEAIPEEHPSGEDASEAPVYEVESDPPPPPASA